MTSVVACSIQILCAKSTYKHTPQKIIFSVAFLVAAVKFKASAVMERLAEFGNNIPNAY